MDYLDRVFERMTDDQEAKQLKKERRSRIIKDRQMKITILMAKCPQYTEDNEA